MTLSFPLSLDAFWNRLPIGEATIALPQTVETSRTAGGDVLVRSLGERLWAGEVTLDLLDPSEYGEVEALLAALGEPGRTFEATDVRRPHPAHDPSGALLAGASPQIHGLGSDPRTLELRGLPAGYRLTPGDYLRFDYSGRRALHRVVEPVAVGGTGRTGLFEVTPGIRPGATIGRPVDLSHPSCYARLRPGSFDAGSARTAITRGLRFGWQQVLR
jgi:hypothetical protein